MRVAWDLQAVTGPKPTGLGVAAALYQRAIEQHAPEVQLLGLRPNEQNQPLRGVPDRLCWEQWRLPQALAREHRRAPLDLHFTPALGAPLRRPVPQVTQIQDLIPLVYPEAFHGVSGWYWKRLLPHTWRRSTALTVSNNVVADDVAEQLGYDRARIHVVPLYADPEWPQLAAAAPAPVTSATFVMVGSHEPRKNLELALRGLGAANRRGSVGADLVSIGIETDYTAEVRWLASVEGVEFAVSGYLDRPAVATLVRGCTALLFPSRYEGFGLPPLEAMSVGCAVVLSDIPVHRAVYDDARRWEQCPPDCRERPPFVGVDDVDGMAQIMLRLVEDSTWRSALRRSGLAYSATFSALATAEALLAAFNAVKSLDQ